MTPEDWNLPVELDLRDYLTVKDKVSSVKIINEPLNGIHDSSMMLAGIVFMKNGLCSGKCKNELCSA